MTPSEKAKLKEIISRLKEKMKPSQTLKEAITEELHEGNFSISSSPNIKTNNVMYMIIDRKEISMVCIDLTGCFTCKSSSGNEYVMVTYHYDAYLVMGRALQIGKPQQSHPHGKQSKIYLAKQELHQILEY